MVSHLVARQWQLSTVVQDRVLTLSHFRDAVLHLPAVADERVGVPGYAVPVLAVRRGHGVGGRPAQRSPVPEAYSAWRLAPASSNPNWGVPPAVSTATGPVNVTVNWMMAPER